MTRTEAIVVIETSGFLAPRDLFNWNDAIERLMAESIEDFNWTAAWVSDRQELEQYSIRIEELKGIIYGG